MIRKRRAIAAAYTVCLAVLSCGESDTDGRIVATGTVECTQIDVAARSAGIVVSLTTKEGQSVDSGQALGRIDHSALDWQLAEAGAALSLARANLQLAMNGPRPEDVAQAEAALRQAQVGARAAVADRERVERLAASGTATLKQLDDSRARVDGAEATVAMAEATLAKLRAGTRSEHIAAAGAQVERAEAGAGLIAQRISDCTVRAPTSGVVTERLIEPGEMAVPGTALLTLTKLDDAWLQVYLTEMELGAVQLGQRADVYLDASPETPRSGTVAYISPTAEFTPKNVQTREERVKLVFGVRLSLDSADGALKPGLPADAVFRPAEAR